jgi:glycosyltransferase involved in cell wall biosynthesis
VADRFRWLGQVDLAGKLDLLGRIDVLAMPATHPEAKGIPVLEAFAAGVPVVAADAGALPEYVRPEASTVAGLLHRPGDALDLARQLASLQDDAELAASLGRGGFARARERYTRDRMVDGHAEIYAAIRSKRT